MPQKRRGGHVQTAVGIRSCVGRLGIKVRADNARLIVDQGSRSYIRVPTWKRHGRPVRVAWFNMETNALPYGCLFVSRKVVAVSLLTTWHESKIR